MKKNKLLEKAIRQNLLGLSIGVIHVDAVQSLSVTEVMDSKGQNVDESSLEEGTNGFYTALIRGTYSEEDKGEKLKVTDNFLIDHASFRIICYSDERFVVQLDQPISIAKI